MEYKTIVVHVDAFGGAPARIACARAAFEGVPVAWNAHRTIERGRHPDRFCLHRRSP